MSWLFSQALVEEYSAGSSTDAEPWSQLSVTLTPHKFWRNDKTMEFSKLSQFGLTLRLLTADRGEELLMSYLAAFPAKTSAQLEPAPASMDSEADSGPTWFGLFARYNHAESKWKTAQCSLLADSDEFSETWPRWGSMRNGVSYLRPIPELPICESESGSWPTPKANDAEKRGNFDVHNPRNGLPAAVKKWTTPSASDAFRGGQITDQMTGSSLAQQVNTPRKWPTPCASASKGSPPASLPRKSDASRANDRIDHAVMASDGGQLNPAWVEWLMGWPIGWTELKPLGMDKFLAWKQQHGIFSPDNHKEAA